MSRPFSITIDAADPRSLAEFWMAALGYVTEQPPSPFTTWPDALTAWGVPDREWNSAAATVDPEVVRPRLFLQRCPGGKTAENRVRLHVHSGAGRPGAKDMAVVRALAVELAGLGATQVAEFDAADIGQWIVMTDPEGNEFCVV